MTPTIVDSTFPSVVRTSRGLTVGGRRLTLYFLQDHFRSGWPPELVMDWFDLTPKEIGDVVGYIAAHRDEFEAEYQEVVRESDETRRYWEQRNRRLLEEIRSRPAAPVAADTSKESEAHRSRSGQP